MPRGKRTADDLTGGSGDVNPQEFVITGTQTGNDALTVITQPLPIPRLPTREGYNLVIEVLSVVFYWLNGLIPTAGTNQTILFNLTTNPTPLATTGLQLADTRSVARWFAQSGLLAGGTSTPFQVENDSGEIDLTDKAGHGYLVATDNIFFQLASVTTGQANQGICRFSYRWKEVTLKEYIGIVQSQQ